MVETMDRVWPSRHFTFWMLPAIAAAEQRDAYRTPEMEELAETIRRQTREDLLCNPPKVIIMDDLRRRPAMQDFDFDGLAFFRRDPELDAFLDHYERIGTVEHFTIYQAGSAPETTKPNHCRPIY